MFAKKTSSETTEDKFDLVRPHYDQSTFFGRLRHFAEVINPMLALTRDEELQQSLKLLADFGDGSKAGRTSDEELWQARKIKESIIHPDTGEVVPLPFRMSAFVPLNLPLCLGMLTASTVPTTVFWQWANQTYNVCVNYANRNASNTLSYQQIGTAYVGAVVSSCSIAVGLRHAARRLQRPLLRSFIPFVAVATAGALNVALMRSNELLEGIAVKDEDGETRGISLNAGQSAISQVAISRVVLPAPILILPPIILNALKKAAMIPTSPRLKLAVEAGIMTVCLALALPVAIALFPQESRMSVEDLEEKFQQLKNKKGERITHLFFNKGL